MESLPIQMPQNGNDLYFVVLGVLLTLWIVGKFGTEFYRLLLEKRGDIAPKARAETPMTPVHQCEVNKLADELSSPLREITDNLKQLNSEVRGLRNDHARTHERVVEMQTAQKFGKQANG